MRGGRSPTLAISIGRVFGQQGAESAGVLALDFFGFRNRRAQADGEIVGEMIAAHRDGRGVAHHSAGEGDQFGGAAADIEQAGAEFALVLREAGFGGSERLEHRVVHAHAGAIHGGDNILRGGAGGGDDVHVRFEALADHADGVADIVLRVEKKFLRQDVQHFAIFRQAARRAPLRWRGARRRAAHRGAATPTVMPPRLFTPRTCTPATPISADSTGTPTIVSASSTARRIELTARSRLTIWPLRQPFDSAAPSAANFTPPSFVQFADQRAGFGAADVERYDVPFFLRQITLLTATRCLRPQFQNASPTAVPILDARCAASASVSRAAVCAGFAAAALRRFAGWTCASSVRSGFTTASPSKRRSTDSTRPAVARHCADVIKHV